MTDQKILIDVMHQLKELSDRIDLKQFDNEQGLELNVGRVWYCCDDRTLVGCIGYLPRNELDLNMDGVVRVLLDQDVNEDEDPNDGEDMFERAMRRKYPVLPASRF